MAIPIPTPIYRIVYVENLTTILRRGEMHATNHIPDDGLPYRTIHSATFTEWFDDLERLDAVDWDMVYQRYWADSLDDMDRQRRKQAEFLVHQFCPWSLITEIGVIDNVAKARVESLFASFDVHLRRPVHIQAAWYY